MDETKTHGSLMFRLAESVNTVLVHERVRDCLGMKNPEFLEDIAFYETTEVAT